MHLVTGSTGIVGTRLLYELLIRGYKVRALKRDDSDLCPVRGVFRYLHENGDDLFEKIEWVEGDVLDTFSLEKAMQGVEYVYHAAAIVSFHSSDESKMFEINVDGTANVCNVALSAGVRKLCHVSSTAAIGRSEPGQHVAEKTEWKDSKFNSTYSLTKRNAEREVWRIIEEGLPAVIVNPAIIVGPGDFSRSSARIFSKIDEGLSHYPSGSNAYVDVGDVARACIELQESEIAGERFLLAGENLSYREFLSNVAHSLGKKPPAKPATPFKMKLALMGEKIRSWFGGPKPTLSRQTIINANNEVTYSSEKIKEALGFRFTPLRDAICDTAMYYKLFRNRS